MWSARAALVTIRYSRVCVVPSISGVVPGLSNLTCLGFVSEDVRQQRLSVLRRRMPRFLSPACSWSTGAHTFLASTLPPIPYACQHWEF